MRFLPSHVSNLARNTSKLLLLIHIKKEMRQKLRGGSGSPPSGSSGLFTRRLSVLSRSLECRVNEHGLCTNTVRMINETIQLLQNTTVVSVLLCTGNCLLGSYSMEFFKVKLRLFRVVTVVQVHDVLQVSNWIRWCKQMNILTRSKVDNELSWRSTLIIFAYCRLSPANEESYCIMHWINCRSLGLICKACGYVFYEFKIRQFVRMSVYGTILNEWVIRYLHSTTVLVL